MPKEKIVRVAFSYTVKHIPKGKRNEVSYEILDEVPVALTDLTSAEAPTALRFVPKEWRRSEAKPADHPWWDGRLYGPWDRSYTSEESTATVEEMEAALLRAKESREASYSPFYVAPSNAYNANYVAADAIPPGRTRDDGTAQRNETVAKIMRRAAQMILVDGKVYERAQEPVYALKVMSGFGSDRRSEEPVYHLETIKASEVDANKDPDWIFRADRLDEAVVEIADHENRRRRHHGHPALSPEQIVERCVWNRVEVLMPEVLKFRYDMRPRLEREAGVALDNLKGDVADRDVDFFRVYAGLRDLMAQAPIDHDALAAMLPAVADALRAGHSHTADRIGRTLEEWANRDDPAAVRDADMEALSAAG